MSSDSLLAPLFASYRSSLQAYLDRDPSLERARQGLKRLFEAIGEGGGQADRGDFDRRVLALELLRSATMGGLLAVRASLPRDPLRTGDDTRASHDRDTGPRSESGRGRKPLFPLNLFVRGYYDEPGPPPGAYNPPDIPSTPVVSPSALMSALEAAFEAADRLLVAAKPPPPERVKVAWRDDGELMDLVQSLLSAYLAGDGESSLHHIGVLRTNLKSLHGIETVEYDGTNEALFRFVDTGPVDRRQTTVEPALVAEGRLVRRGEVRGPFPDSHHKSGETAVPGLMSPSDVREGGSTHG